MNFIKKYHIIDVLKKYVSITNRRLTFEYILLDNVNDSKEDALKLVKLLKGINCYVNLIPYNETNSGGFKRSSKNKILAFFDILKKNNTQVTTNDLIKDMNKDAAKEQEDEMKLDEEMTKQI